MTTKKAIIKFDSSWARVEGVDNETLARIKTALTYTDTQLEYTNKYGSKYAYKDPVVCLLKGTNKFYTGLMARVVWVLKNCGYDYETVRELECVYPTQALLLPEWFYGHQVDMLKAALELKRGVCQAATGSGKSITMAWLAKHFPTQNIVVTVPEKSLLKQMKKTLEETLEEEIGEVYGEKKIFKRVTVGIINSLSKLATITPSLFKDIEVLICDECHRVGSNFYIDLCLACNNADYKIGFSATAWRRKGDDKVMEGLLGPRLIEIKEQDLVNKGILATPIYITVPYKSPRKTYPGITSSGTYNTKNGKPDRLVVYNSAIVYNTERNNYIVKVANNYIKACTDLGCLILVESIEHGQILSNLFNLIGESVPFISGTTSLKERRQTVERIQNGELKLVIASSVFNEGQDIPRLGCGIIAGGGSSDIKIVQQVGRFIRLYPNKTHGVIIDIADDEEFYLQHNFYTRKNKISSVYPKSLIVLSKEDSIREAANGFIKLQN